MRELRNFVERARALGAVEALALASAAADPPPTVHQSIGVTGPSVTEDDDDFFRRTYKSFREAWLDRGEREYLRRLLVRHGSNVAAAAREAELDRTYIYRLLRKHNQGGL